MAFTPAAKADGVYTLPNFNCGGDCPLATYTATIQSNGGSSYTVTLVIQIAPNAVIVQNGTDRILSVNVKFASDLAGVNNGSLTSGPGGVTWTTLEASINNGGCAGSGGGFVCSQASGTGLPIVAGGTYTWVWNVTLADGATLTNAIHIGANYDPATGRIVSQEVEVPEPSTLVLFGAGLAALAALRRRLT